jgi:phosphoribosylformylglycinamidine synthase
MVRTNTVVQASGDAAVIRIKGTSRALALKTDCNARYVYLDPYRGAQIAVAESARNVVCVGAKPLAITNCLNFGNPYKPEIFWQFKEAIQGIGDACRAFNTPVTGGNVSFYNENPEGPVFPTPVIGMLGEIEDIRKIVSIPFKAFGDVIVLLGSSTGSLGASEYLSLQHGIVSGPVPQLDLMVESNLHIACLEMIKGGLVKSMHDCSEGGLCVALAEGCIMGMEHEERFGALIRQQTVMRDDFWLFSEDQSRVIVSISEKNVNALVAIARSYGIQSEVIGEVIRSDFIVGNRINLTVDEMRRVYYDSLRQRVEVP